MLQARPQPLALAEHYHPFSILLVRNSGHHPVQGRCCRQRAEKESCTSTSNGAAKGHNGSMRRQSLRVAQNKLSTLVAGSNEAPCLHMKRRTEEGTSCISSLEILYTAHAYRPRCRPFMCPGGTQTREYDVLLYNSSSIFCRRVVCATIRSLWYLLSMWASLPLQR